MKSQVSMVLVFAVAGMILAVCSRGASTEENKDTIVLVVRHAEKESTSDNPSLTAAGHRRAEALARLVSKAGVEAIFASTAARTQQTVQPLAAALTLNVNTDEQDMNALATHLLDKYRGKVTLVAGHSNTVPQLIAALGGEIAPIAETEFDNYSWFWFRKAEGRASFN